MATDSSRSRAANVGHHLDGTLVENADGTKIFRQNISLVGSESSVEIDADGNLQVSGLALQSILNRLNELIMIQKGMLKLLETAFDDNLSSAQQGDIL